MNSSIGRTTNRLQIGVVETTSLSKTTRRNKINSSGINFATASTNVRIFKFPHLQTLASPNAHIFKCIFSKLSPSKTLIFMNSHLYELSSLMTLISLCKHACTPAEYLGPAEKNGNFVLNTLVFQEQACLLNFRQVCDTFVLN